MAEKKTEVKEQTAEVAEKKIPYDEERVSYTVPTTYQENESDLFVGVRGERWQMKRGETVMIPRYVLWAIKDAERQRFAAFNHIKNVQEKSREAFAKM